MDKEFEEDNRRVGKHGKIKEKKKKKKSIWRIIFKIIMILIIIMVIMLGVVAGYIYSKWIKIDYQGNALDNVEINEGVQKTGYLNIALFGIDSRDNDYDDASGSDTILVVSINMDTKEIKMASIYRDSYLAVTDKSFDKLTDIYRKNGVEKTVSVLNKNLDLDITEYVNVNFDVVVDVINAVGGVELEITKADLKYINTYIDEIRKVTGEKSSRLTKAGTYTVDGVQALAYARIRYVGTDIDRAARQREVLTKAFEKVKHMNMAQINNLIDVVLPQIRTTLSPTEIASLASGITQYNIASSMGFPYEWADYQPNGIYYLAPRNLEANVVQLHQELFGEEEYQVSEQVKTISNKLINKTGIK